jgi:pimeloyl-ACP methyl ester carboxylesterase/DNA-binding CsgD family transcriptional regulator
LILSSSVEETLAQGQTASPVLAALYAYAIDPLKWEQLVDSMDGLEGPEMEAFGEHLSQALILHENSPIGANNISRPGLIVFDAELNILEINPKGRAALNRLSCNSALGARLEFSSFFNALALREGLKRVNSNDCNSTLVQLKDANNQVLICKLQGHPSGSSKPETYHLIVSNLPDAATSAELIRMQLELTNSESELAARLSMGRTIKGVSEDLEISIHTARTHLRSIFQKLGINRQSELVRLVVELVALNETPYDAGTTGEFLEGLPERQAYKLADGRVITYREFGDVGGLPVFFFHNGYGVSALAWTTLDLITAKGMRCFHLERPGFGLSTVKPEYTIDSVAADLAEVIDGMSFPVVALMASAGGTPFALATARKLKTTLRKVTIINGRPGGGGTTAREGLPPAPTRVFKRLKKSPWLAEAFIRIMRPTLHSKRGGEFLASVLVKSHEDQSMVQREIIQKQMLRGLRESMVVTGKGIAQEFSHGVTAPAISIAQFPCPLHIWHGERDNFISAEEMIAYAETCPSARLKVIPNMGHEVRPEIWEEICDELVRP